MGYWEEKIMCRIIKSMSIRWYYIFIYIEAAKRQHWEVFLWNRLPNVSKNWKKIKKHMETSKRKGDKWNAGGNNKGKKK